jgi:transposase
LKLTHLNLWRILVRNATMELQVEIEILYRQGKGVREIARETGLARNTIRGILRGEHDGQYGPRKPRPTELDEHKA